MEELQNCKMILQTPRPGRQHTCSPIGIVAPVVVVNSEVLDIML